MWTGDGRNRFYDKHQRKHSELTLFHKDPYPIRTVIICDNGTSGFLGEHSCMDGTPTLRMNEFMCGAIAAGKITPSASTATSSNVPEPKEIKFDLDRKTLGLIEQSEKNFDKLVGDQELEVRMSIFLSRKSLIRSCAGATVYGIRSCTDKET